MGGSATVAVGGGQGFAGSRASRLGYHRERAPKILDEDLIVSSQDVASADHNNIHIQFRVGGACRLHGRPKASFDPVALGRMTDPLRHRKADPETESVRSAQPSLNRHPLRMKAAARGRRDEVRSFRQAPDQACARTAHRERENGRLRGKALAAMGAASSDDLAATLRRHARTESMAALANELARLIRPFHGSSPVGSRAAALLSVSRPSRVNPDHVLQKRSAPEASAVSSRAYDRRTIQSQRRSAVRIEAAFNLTTP
jgi:hypothetical protein